MLHFNTPLIFKFSDERQSFWMIFAVSGDEKN